MKRSRAARENTWHIDQAAREGKPFKAIGGIDSDSVGLRIPWERDVPEPEPVDVSAINGRAPAGWEQAEIKAARERERRAEWRP